MLDIEANDGYIHTPIITAHIHMHVFVLTTCKIFINLIPCDLLCCHLVPASQLHRKMYSVYALWSFCVSQFVHIFVCASPTLNSPVCQSTCRCTAGLGWTACLSVRDFLPRLQSPSRRAQLDGWDSQSSPRSTGKHTRKQLRLIYSQMLNIPMKLLEKYLQKYFKILQVLNTSRTMIPH